jgi:hypothetical protein
MSLPGRKAWLRGGYRGLAVPLPPWFRLFTASRRVSTSSLIVLPWPACTSASTYALVRTSANTYAPNLPTLVHVKEH